MASTWLPGEYTVPRWLVTGLFAVLFPVFTVALIRAHTSGAGAQLMGRDNGIQFIRYVLVLPTALKIAYASIICLAALGFATGAGAAEDARADASGYYYTYWDKTARPQHSARVRLTEPEYYEALKSQLRIFSAGPAMFYAFSSFLVLISASAAAAHTRSTPDHSTDPESTPGRTEGGHALTGSLHTAGVFSTGCFCPAGTGGDVQFPCGSWGFPTKTFKPDALSARRALCNGGQSHQPSPACRRWTHSRNPKASGPGYW
ncbi:hypothetical protein ACFW9O_33570 [Streptomyces sp. NPDC059499]|uniref:hypothetical protein n=1 Tax=Streptomyces sp. NPDC059499 TaxID=3346852 RepID=UPI0036CA0383